MLLLFDKLIEGRETQAAESWRVSGLSSDRLGTERDSGESAFQAITMAHPVRGNPCRVRLVVKVPVTQNSLDNLQAKPESKLSI